MELTKTASQMWSKKLYAEPVNSDGLMKQIYKITYPTGKIYIGKDAYGSSRYFGSPSIELINEDFAQLPDEVRRDYTVRKEILWESESATDAELAQKEVEMIRTYSSNNPDIGYNRWPKWSVEK